MIESWAPWMDVVLLLALALITIAVIGIVQLISMTREARRQERSRWDAWLDKAYAEAADLYRDDPMGGRTARWDGERR